MHHWRAEEDLSRRRRGKLELGQKVFDLELDVRRSSDMAVIRICHQVPKKCTQPSIFRRLWDVSGAMPFIDVSSSPY